MRPDKERWLGAAAFCRLPPATVVWARPVIRVVAPVGSNLGRKRKGRLRKGAAAIAPAVPMAAPAIPAAAPAAEPAALRDGSGGNDGDRPSRVVAGPEIKVAIAAAAARSFSFMMISAQSSGRQGRRPRWFPLPGLPFRSTFRRPAAAGSLLLLRMQCQVLRFQVGNCLFKALNRDLIAYSQQQPTVSLDPFIDLAALLTHHVRRRHHGRSLNMMPKGLFSFRRNLEQLNFRFAVTPRLPAYKSSDIVKVETRWNGNQKAPRI